MRLKRPTAAQRRSSRASIRDRERGVTLIELMIVVVIITLLTTLAVSGYRKLIYQARNSEAYHFLGAIRSAQTLYYQASGQYAGTSEWAEWPEEDFPQEVRLNWGDPTSETWKALGVRPEGPVWFKYRIRASVIPADAPAGVFRPPPAGPWYVAQARGDFSPNPANVTSLFEVTSAKAAVYVENINE